MRIVILQGAFFPVPTILGGAVEKIWYRMGKEFASLGHEVIHIGCSHPDLPNYETAFGVQYIRVLGYDTPPSLAKLKLLDLFYSVRAIKKVPKNADIIVTNTFWSPFLFRRKISKKVYVDVQRVPRGQMIFYRHVGMLRGCSVSIYDAIKKEMPAKLHKLVSYVPNPVPFDVKPMRVEREKIILFVGRLHPEKGVHILLEAFSKLSKTEANEWRLVIVGPADFKDGGGGEEYLQKLLSLKEKNNVEFIGPVYNDDVLINYYAQASVFCYPAQDSSGDAAPVAPREAMAYGCVPVVSKLECFNDFIFSGKNGFTYNQKAQDQVSELAQALHYIISDPVRLSELAEEAKLIGEKFSAKVIAKQFIQDFERIQSTN